MENTQSEYPDALAHSGTVPSQIETATSSCSNQSVETGKASPELKNNLDIDRFYEAAVKGEIERFKKYDNPLHQLVTPNMNTILHIYITALSKMETSLESYLINRHGRFIDRKTLAVIRKLCRFISRSTPRYRLKFVEEILKMCPDLLLQVNNKEETLLHIAARHGHDEIVEFLIKKIKETHQNDQEIGAARQMLRMMNKAKDTALHEAVRFNHLDVVERLIKEDRDYSYEANAAGETPLYLAADRGYINIVITMVIPTCAPLAYGGPKGRTALHAAVLRNDWRSTRDILIANNDLIKKKDERGWIPLHYAAYYGYSRLVRLLFKYGNSVAAYITTDDGQKTALHIAASRGNVDVMKKLISYCPGCSELVDKRGWNVFHFAVESKNSKAIKLILDNPSLSNLINEYNNDGNTPLHQLAALGFNMPSFIGHPKVDKPALNSKNLNALEILGKDELSREQNDLKKCLQRYGIREGGQVEVNKDEGNTEGKNKDSNITANIQEARNAHLVVATLIATVTFAAGITVPGGYKNDGPDQGTAILTRSLAFKIFVITDTIALMLSSSAVLLHLYMALNRYSDEEKNTSEFIHKLQFTILAMYAMLVAFITGTYAILAPSSGLAISACVLGCIFLLFGHLISEYIFYLIGFVSENILSLIEGILFFLVLITYPLYFVLGVLFTGLVLWLESCFSSSEGLPNE